MTKVVMCMLRVKCLLLYSLVIMHSEWSNEVLVIQIEYKYMYGCGSIIILTLRPYPANISPPPR